jgi:translation initiation factor IF-2
MAKPIRLGKAAGEFNVGMSTIVDFLESNGVSIDSTPNTKLTPEQYDMLRAEYAADQVLHEKSKAQSSVVREKRETISLRDKDKPAPAPVVESEPTPEPVAVEPTPEPTPEPEPAPTPEPVAEKEETPEPVEEVKAPEPEVKEEAPKAPEADDKGLKVKMVGKIDLDSINTKTRPDKSKAEKPKAKEEAPVAKKEEPKPEPKKEEPKKEEKKPEVKPTETIRAQSAKLGGPKVVGKIELPVERPKSSGNSERRKRKRVRKIDVNKQSQGNQGRGKKPKVEKPEITEKDIQREIKETLARLSNKGGKSKASKNRRAKRDSVAQRRQEEEIAAELEEKILKLTEFVTVSELATMMNVSSTEVISACMSLGIFASINQRLDAETIHIVAEEFGFETEFVSVIHLIKKKPFSSRRAVFILI